MFFFFKNNKKIKPKSKPVKQKKEIPFEENFKNFLEILGIDYQKYAYEPFKTKDNQTLTLADINATNVLQFDWAKFLAQKQELVWIESHEDTLQSLEKFENFRGGLIKNNLKQRKRPFTYYRDDIKSLDAGRFEYAKNIDYFLDDVCSHTGAYFCPVYIEVGGPDDFVFAIINNDLSEEDDKKLSKLIKLANKMGIYAKEVSCNMLNTPNIPQDKKAIQIKKNYHLETRNNEIIKEIKIKRTEKQKKLFDTYLQNAEPVTLNNSKFKGVEKGFKCDDTVECCFFNKNHKLKVFCLNKDENQPLDKNEISLLNWFVSSNILDDKTTQFKALIEINQSYAEIFDNPKFRTNISKEVDITAIGIDFPYIAFCGEAKCNSEHGISLNFKDKQFIGVGNYMDWNYGEDE